MDEILKKIDEEIRKSEQHCESEYRAGLHKAKEIIQVAQCYKPEFMAKKFIIAKQTGKYTNVLTKGDVIRGSNESLAECIYDKFANCETCNFYNLNLECMKDKETCINRFLDYLNQPAEEK